MADKEQLYQYTKLSSKEWADWIFKKNVKADLSGATLKGNANFQGAELTGCNFSKITITLGNFSDAKLFSSNFNDATLSEIHFLRAELYGANFSDAELQGCDFTDAFLRKANFRNADLSHANLSRVQALGTDFRGAIMTGVCIKDWNVNSETKIDETVNCKFVYLEENGRERRPSYPDRDFEPGEFAALVQKYIHTVDLIFTKGIDWKAFLSSYHNIQVEYGEQNVSIQAIEQKIDGAFVIRLSVPPEADKAEIETKAIQLYETKLKVLEAQYRYELQGLEAHHKDEIILLRKEHNTQILELAKLAASRPITVEAKAVAENQSKNVEVEMNINAPSKGVVGKMTGDMNIYTSEQKQSIAEVATEIVKLLDYFKQNDPSITEAQQMVKTVTEEQPEILDAEIVEEAINLSPTLRQRLKAAGKAAYIETVKMLLPPFGVAYEAYEAYKDPK